jgi:hypothetical protein
VLGDSSRLFVAQGARAWIATPERAALTDSEVHNAVDYRPSTRYDVAGGYLAIDALTKEAQP